MRIRGVLSYWPLAVLCVLLSSRWMLADAWPDTVSTASSQAVAAVLAAVGCAALAAVRKASESESQWPLATAGAGALLFAGLNSGLLAGNASPKETDVLVALALAPAVIAVALVSRGEAGAGLNGKDVAPGLLASAGLLLIVAQPGFRSLGEDVALLGTPLCAGLGVVWLAVHGGETFTMRRAAMAFGGAAVVFAAVSLRLPRSRPSLAAVGLDLAVQVLVVWSLARLGPRRFSAQFAGVPLLLLLEGLLLTRVRPDWEQVCGLAMLVVASLLLLRAPQTLQAEESQRLFS